MWQFRMVALRTPEDWRFSGYVLEVLWLVILNNFGCSEECLDFEPEASYSNHTLWK